MKNPIALVLFIFCFLTSVQIQSQDFYSMDKIQEIKIYFTQPNWRQLLNTAAASATEPFTIAKKISINGIVFDSIGAKFKGNSTFKASNIKNPWHIELDHVKDQNYLGYKDIKLANVFADPTFIREALSYELMQPYTDLPRANFAKVWVNDTLMGLYTNTEAITKTFCKKHFYSSDNNVFVKCTPPSLMSGGGSSSLVYLGIDSSQYYKSYEMKSDFGWKQLIQLCDTLNNATDQIEKILDVDRTLWMLAFNILFVNLDSYTGGFTQNYYLWKDDNRQFDPIIWDLNQSLGSFTNAVSNMGGPGIPGVGTDSLSLARLYPYTHETNASKPLISKLLSNPRYRKMFRAHLLTMTQEAFKTNKYLNRAIEIQTIIDSYVKEDPNKFYSYDQFKSNLYYGISGGQGGPGGGGQGGGTVGVVSLMKNRINYLDTLADMKYAVPNISNVNNTTGFLNDTAWIKATITGHSSGGVFLGYRLKNTDFFTRVVMYDDGKHHDGNANDGLFAYGLKIVNPSIQYYIWAENTNAGVFSPARSEHEYYNINAITIARDVVINELMASNSKTAKDPNGQYDDWIELFNKSNQSIDISGWYISDDPDKHGKWKFPKNTSIPSQGYLIVWADEDSSQNTATSFHSNFKLSASGESVILSNTDTSLIDQVVFGAQKTDMTYARIPNGTGAFIITAPTYNANNNNSTPVDEITSNVGVHIFPNPVTRNTLHISVSNNDKHKISVYNTLGQNIYTDTLVNEKQIDTQGWSRGLYILWINHKAYKILIP